MRLEKIANGKTILKITKQEWEDLGRKSGILNQTKLPKKMRKKPQSPETQAPVINVQAIPETPVFDDLKDNEKTKPKKV